MRRPTGKPWQLQSSSESRRGAARPGLDARRGKVHSRLQCPDSRGVTRHPAGMRTPRQRTPFDGRAAAMRIGSGSSSTPRERECYVATMPTDADALDKVVRTDFPGDIANAWAKLDASQAPDKIHEACVALAKALIGHLTTLLSAEYREHRRVAGPIEAVENGLSALAKKSNHTLGETAGVALVIWQNLARVDRLSGVNFGPDKARVKGGAFVAAWSEVKEAWAEQGTSEVGVGVPYALTLRRAPPPKAAQTSLREIIESILNHRNAHAHWEAWTVKKDTIPVKLTFSEAYYAALAPMLRAALTELLAALQVPLSAFVLHEIVRVEVGAMGRRVVAKRLHGLGTAREVTLDDPEERLKAPSRWLVDAGGVAVLRLDAQPLSPHSAAASAAPRADVLPVHVISVDRAQLPTPFTVPFRSKQDSFVGRDEQLASLHTLLMEGRRTVVGQAAGIHGMGGVGKTQLAVEYCWRHRDDYPDGVVWFDVTEDRRAQWAGFALAALGGRSDDKQENLAALTREWMGRKRNYLLVLDNVEESTPVEEWLPARPERVLVTSRHRIAGTWAALPLDMLKREAACTLLIQTAGLAGTDREGAAAIDKLCDALCDFPLAIEIAGAFLGRYDRVTVADYIGLIAEKGVTALDDRGTIGPTRHQASVVATLALNRERLADRPETVRLVETLALWPGHALDTELLLRMAGFLVGIAGTVALSEATRLSLVRSQEKSTAIHPFLQEVVRAELAVKGMGDKGALLRTGMVAASAAWLRQRVDKGHQAAVGRVHGGLLTLVGQAAEADALDKAVVLRELGRHQVWGGGFAVAAAGCLRPALALFGGLGRPMETADAEVVLSEALMHLALYEESATLATKALATLDGGEKPDVYLLLRALQQVAWVTLELGQHEAAHRLTRRALELARVELRGGDPALGMAHNNYGSTLMGIRRRDEAVEHYERALAILTESLGGAHPDVALTHNNLGVALSGLGRDREALTHKRLGLDANIAAFGDASPQVARSRVNLGVTLRNLGRFEEALVQIQAGMDFHHASGRLDHPDVAVTHRQLAGALHSLGRHREAHQHACKGLAMLERTLPANHPDIKTQRDNVAAFAQALNKSRPGFRQVPERGGAAKPPPKKPKKPR